MFNCGLGKEQCLPCCQALDAESAREVPLGSKVGSKEEKEKQYFSLGAHLQGVYEIAYFCQRAEGRASFRKQHFPIKKKKLN